MNNFFVILGGMGTLATESFIHSLNKKTPSSKDQDYLNYVVVNHATIPDRTEFIKDSQAADPRPYLLKDIQDFAKLEPNFFVLTCNTAHYFFDELQASTTIPLLHMPKIATNSLNTRYHIKKNSTIFFLGTEGSLFSQVYKNLIESEGYQYRTPALSVQKKINHLIYEDVKQKKYLNYPLFYEILSELLEIDPQAHMLLGCTELSCLFEQFTTKLDFPIIDAQNELIDFILTHSNQEKRTIEV